VRVDRNRDDAKRDYGSVLDHLVGLTRAAGGARTWQLGSTTLDKPEGLDEGDCACKALSNCLRPHNQNNEQNNEVVQIQVGNFLAPRRDK
jgi:hypothetical protein